MTVSYKEVTASRGKWVRAEPVSALYAQDLMRHVGRFPDARGWLRRRDVPEGV